MELNAWPLVTLKHLCQKNYIFGRNYQKFWRTQALVLWVFYIFSCLAWIWTVQLSSPRGNVSYGPCERQSIALQSKTTGSSTNVSPAPALTPARTCLDGSAGNPMCHVWQHTQPQCCQPWLTLGSQHYPCGLGYPRGIAAFWLVCEIVEGWWEGLKYVNSNGPENNTLIFLCHDS